MNLFAVARGFLRVFYFCHDESYEGFGHVTEHHHKQQSDLLTCLCLCMHTHTHTLGICFADRRYTESKINKNKIYVNKTHIETYTV